MDITDAARIGRLCPVGQLSRDLALLWIRQPTLNQPASVVRCTAAGVIAGFLRIEATQTESSSDLRFLLSNHTVH